MSNREPFGEFDRLRRQIEDLIKPLQEQMDLINNTLAKVLLPKLNLPKVDPPRIDFPKIHLSKIDIPKVDLAGMMPNYVAAVESISRIGRGFEATYLKPVGGIISADNR